MLKIGQVAQLMHLSPETLRFYEEVGIVSPERTRGGSYREYSTWDIFNLTNCIEYRNMGFSVKDTRAMIAEDDLDTMNERLRKREDELSFAIQKEVMVRTEIRRLREHIDAAPLNIGNYWFREDEGFLELASITYKNNDYQDFDCTNQLLAAWMRSMPITKAMMRVSVEAIEGGDESIEWVYATDSESAKKLQLPIYETVRSIPRRLCMHTIIDAGGQHQMNITALHPVVDHVSEQGFQIDGSLYGELLTRIHDGGEWHRYIELTIPVKK